VIEDFLTWADAAARDAALLQSTRCTPAPPTRSSKPPPRCPCAPSARTTAAHARPRWPCPSSCCRAHSSAGSAARDSAGHQI
jgi:hypothetical protein